MNKITYGTCSRCGGPVTIPSIFWSTIPPVPTCEHCGAHRKEKYGPILEMK